MQVLVPYLDEYWRSHILMRGLERDNYTASAFPPERADQLPARLEAREGQRRHRPRSAAFTGARCVRHALRDLQRAARRARGVQRGPVRGDVPRDQRLARRRVAVEATTGLRASIVVPMHSPELAAKEIERMAADPRFVQVLVWEMSELPLGRRIHWPIYRAAERLDLPIGIHAGSSYRHPPTNLGWPSYYLEDYVSWSTGFAGVLNSLITEGVFVEFPRLKVVLMESGVTWLPGWMWRADKTWRGVRAEVPWLEKSPAAYAREHVRLTIQPFDAPPRADQLQRIIEEIGSDEMLLFSTDYPHWHFDDKDALPDGLPDHLLRKILVDNALKTFPRLSP